MSLNRLSGLFCIGFGLLLYLVIIPFDTEVVDYGWVRPQTLPNAMAWILVAAGTVLTVKPSGDVDFNYRRSLRAAFFLGLLSVGVFAISQLGFLAVSPVLALALMLSIGERRPVWLILGTAGLPFAIWLVVSVLLDRPLP